MDRQVTTPSYSHWQDVLKAKNNYFGSPNLKTMFALQVEMERYTRIMQVHAAGIGAPYPTCYFEGTSLFAAVWPDGRWKIFFPETLKVDYEGKEKTLEWGLAELDSWQELVESQEYE